MNYRRHIRLNRDTPIAKLNVTGRHKNGEAIFSGKKGIV
jgi:hypothetical protein